MPATDKIQALKDAHAAMKATRKAAREAYDALEVAYQAAYVEDEDTAYETLNALTDADLAELEAEIWRNGRSGWGGADQTGVASTECAPE